jgi:hypothetical protein
VLLRDVEDFARRNPWAVAAGGFALGFVASRLLKASSSERYRASTRSTGGTETGLLRGEAEPRTSELAYGSSASGTPSPAVPPEPTVARRS